MAAIIKKIVVVGASGNVGAAVVKASAAIPGVSVVSADAERADLLHRCKCPPCPITRRPLCETLPLTSPRLWSFQATCHLPLGTWPTLALVRSGAQRVQWHVESTIVFYAAVAPSLVGADGVFINIPPVDDKKSLIAPVFAAVSDKDPLGAIVVTLATNISCALAFAGCRCRGEARRVHFGVQRRCILAECVVECALPAPYTFDSL